MALNFVDPPIQTPLFSDAEKNNLSRAWVEWFGAIGNRLNSIGLIDRGDPTAVDYTLASFTADGTWRDKDLSSIVPAGAKAVCLAVRVNDAAAGTKAMFRKNGNSSAINVSTITTQVASLDKFEDLIVACDSSRVIEYNIAAAMDAIDVTVKGWWI